MDPAMEFGGLVEPPSHLNVTSKKQAPQGRPAELRTVPDYDYSLFRYSKLALPSLLLIIIIAAVLIGLTLWQGPYGYIRGKNGFQEGRPLDFHLQNIDKQHEAGLQKSLRSLRCANFVIGTIPLLLAIFAIRSELAPGALKGILLLCAGLFFCLSIMSMVSFALGIDQVHRIKDCPDMTFPADNVINRSPAVNFSPGNNPDDYNLDNPAGICWKREQLSSATIAADCCESVTAFILGLLLIYTTTQNNWAWGPGKIPVEKSANQPRITFPPPSPFTHIAETRRTYVWGTIFFLASFVVIAFILTIIMHELRIKVRQVDARNYVNFKSGWPTRANRFRLSMGAFAVAFSILSLLDLIGWKRRLAAYTLWVLFFWLMIGLLICFSIDVKYVGSARKDYSCPTGTDLVQIKCMQWAYFATCFVEFFLATIIAWYIVSEFAVRVFTGWDTFYFYADSEWLRNHSLFVDQTDREAFDWKKYVMDSGKEYYYSPSLGISTRMRPRNYVDPEGYGDAVGFNSVYVNNGVAAPVII